MASTTKATELHIDRLKQGRLRLRMIGTTPLEEVTHALRGVEEIVA
jgi:hypothetical protein